MKMEKVTEYVAENYNEGLYNLCFSPIIMRYEEGYDGRSIKHDCRGN